MVASIEDVARRAGVSIATVSRALRGLPDVAPATRDKVLVAASELDYVASPFAARLASGRTATVGLVVPFVNRWFFGEVIGAVPKKTDWTIFFQRGIAYERLKQWDKAEPNFKRALELNPEQPQVLNYLGYSWVDKNINLDQGIDMIRRAVELRPNDGYIVDSLGWAHYRLGSFDEAVTELATSHLPLYAQHSWVRRP